MKTSVLKELNSQILFKSDYFPALRLPLFNTKVPAGFPSPANDYIETTLDLNELCVDNPSATYFLRTKGDSMIDVGIYPDDILVVDRSLEAKEGDIIIAALNGEFTVKKLSLKPQTKLIPMNSAYSEVLIKEGDDFLIFGVVKHAIHSF